MDRSSGSASRLFSALLGRGRVLLGEGCCATEDEVPLDLSADTVALSVCKSASGSNGRWGSGDGVQPSRRRLLRTCFSSSPSRPPIQRLLLPLALRRRMIRSRLWASLYAKSCLKGVPLDAPARPVHQTRDASGTGAGFEWSNQSIARYRSDPRTPIQRA